MFNEMVGMRQYQTSSCIFTRKSAPFFGPRTQPTTRETKMSMISHGLIHTLPELCQKASSMHNQSVRVLGRLDEYDATAARGTIVFERWSLSVDVSKVPGGDPHRVGSTYQYIGEVDSSGGGDPAEPRPVLRARVARCVDGLDVAVYNLALKERDTFLKAGGPKKKVNT